MTELKINPKFKNALPPLAEDEFKELEGRVLQDGIIHPLIVWNGTIVDGHNRYELAKKHKLTFQTLEMEFENEDIAQVWIVSNQIARRNVSAFERVKLSLKFEPIISAQNKRRQAEFHGNQHTSGLVKNSAQVQNSTGGDNPQLVKNSAQAEKNALRNKTREQLARIAGTSHDTMRKAKKIINEAPPELLQEVEDGVKTINAAYCEIQTGEKICPGCDTEKPMREFQAGKNKLCVECFNKRRRDKGKTPEQIAEREAEKKELELIREIAARMSDPDTVMGFVIERFEIEFEANVNDFFVLVKDYITDYSHLWKEDKYKKIAIAALDNVITTIADMKGLIS